MAFLYI